MPAFHATASDGCAIAYRVEGPAGAPAIAFCTMGTAAMSVWASVADPLAARFQVILHDRRGDGDSDPGSPQSHSFARYAEDLLTVLDACAAPRAHVCGMAFGARVALRLAVDHPERLDRLLLFDVTGGPPAPEAERTAGRDEARRLRDAAGLATPAHDPAWFRRRDPAGRGLNRHALEGQPAWAPDLGRIAAPTLVVCGEQDPNFAGARRVAREIPGARFAAMPMTGHASILDRPDLILSLIEGFLDGERIAAEA